MATLKTSNNLFLEKEELQHLIQSLQENGYEQFFHHAVTQWGVGKSISDPNFDSLKVSIGGVGNSIVINAGFAFDANKNILVGLEDKQVSVLPDGIKKYIIISHLPTVQEKGTVTINASGQVTGVGTEFTKVIRGGANFPSKIKFHDSVSNTGDYQVQSVINDTTLQLNIAANTLVAQTGQPYSVIGTFTPGITPAANDKFPLIKDDYLVEVLPNNTSNGTTHFLLAEVTNTGGTIVVQDRRFTNIFQLGNNGGDSQPPTINPLIGIEKITYSHRHSSRENSVVTFGWGFNVGQTNWSFNNSTGEITIIDGFGGVWRDKAPFTPGDFDNWMIVIENTGVELLVASSSIIGVDIVLTLATPPQNLPSNGILSIVPNCQHVQFKLTNINPTEIGTNNLFTFTSNQSSGKCELPMGMSFTCEWRMVNGINVGEWKPTNASLAPTENHHDRGGVQIGVPTVTIPPGTLQTTFDLENHHLSKASKVEDNLFLAINRFSGQISSEGRLIYPPPLFNISGIQTNYPNIENSAIKLNVTAPNTIITGLTAGSNGQQLQIINASSSIDVLYINLADPSATGAQIGAEGVRNQLDPTFGAPTQIVIEIGHSVTFRYDQNFGRWIACASSLPTNSVRPQSFVIPGNQISEMGNSNSINFNTQTQSGIAYWKIHAGVVTMKLELFCSLSNGSTLNGLLWDIPSSVWVKFKSENGTSVNTSLIIGTAYILHSQNFSIQQQLVAYYSASANQIAVFFTGDFAYSTPFNNPFLAYCSFSWIL